MPVLNWKRIAKVLPLSLLLVGSVAHAGGCLTVQKISRDFSKLGPELEVQSGDYDVQGLESTHLSPTTLAEYLKEYRTIGDVPGSLFINSFKGAKQTGCKVGDRILIPKGNLKGYVLEAGKNYLKYGTIPDTGVTTIRRLGKRRYESFNTSRLKNYELDDYCGAPSVSPAKPASLVDLTIVQVLEFGKKGSLPAELPISNHLMKTMAKAVTQEPNPKCPSKLTQQADAQLKTASTELSTADATRAIDKASAGSLSEFEE